MKSAFPRYDVSFLYCTIVAGAIPKRNAAPPDRLHSTNGRVSSRIQIARPWVPITRSFSRGWTMTSS